MWLDNNIKKNKEKEQKMKTIITTVVIASIFSVLFAVVLNWSMGIDYSPVNASMIPLGITMVVGIIALSAWGGVLGAWLDNQETK
jgi:putative effector of murein hydrolase